MDWLPGLGHCEKRLLDVARRTAVLVDQRSFLLLLRDAHRRSEFAESNARLDELSRTDTLTGLANRRHAATHIDRVFRETEVPPRNLAFLMIDIDHFKMLNDTLGHSEGDDCIYLAGKAIEGCLRQSDDLVSRYGGEEFLVLLTKVSLDDATIIAERIRRSVLDLNLANPKAQPLGIVSVSIGVAVIGENEAAEAAITRSDEALYEAKAIGRNRVGVAR